MFVEIHAFYSYYLKITHLYYNLLFLISFDLIFPSINVVGQVKLIDFALTPQDSVWLQKKNFTLRFGINPYWPPIDYLNEDGKHDGLNAEYIKLFSEITGINIEYVVHETWSQHLSSIKNREIDFIGAINYTPERDEYLLFTTSYLEIPNFFISTTTFAKKKNKDLSTATFAVVSDYAYLSDLKKNYPNASFIYFNKDISALINTSFGISDVCVLDMPSVTFLINKYGISNLVALSDANLPWQIRMAVTKSEPQLQSILNRFLASISPDSKIYLHDKYLSKLTLNENTTIRNILYFILFALATTFIILSITFIYNSRLKTQIAEKTKELKETNDRYSLTISATFDSIFDLDLIQKTICFETGFFKLFEFESKRKSFPLSDWKKIIIPEDQEEVKFRYASLSENKIENWNCKFRIRTQNNSIKWLSLNGIVTYSEQGTPVRIFGAIKDISDSAIIQQELDAEKKNNEALINNTSDLIWSVSKDLKLIASNRQFQLAIHAYIGSTLESGESVEPLFKVLPIEEKKIWIKNFKRAFEGDGFKTEVCIPGKEAIPHQYAELSFNPIFENNSVQSIALHLHDITEKTIHLNEIEEQNNLLKEVTWMQSHIVRAPLSRLLTIIELIKSYPDSLRDKEKISMLTESALELDNIITDISNKAESVTKISSKR